MNRVFRETVRFELAYYGARISTWVYFGIFLGLSVLLIGLFGGAFPNAQAGIMGSGGNVHVNSPWVITLVTGIMSLFGVLVTAALLGNAVFRDFETGMHPLFFTAPITKASYLGGRFVGALLVNALVFLGMPLGLMLGSVMPYLDRARFGAVIPWAYLHPYLLVVLPNLRKGLMVSLFLSFSFLFGEFVFANMLVGTRYETLQVYLNNMKNSSGHFNSALVISYFFFVLVFTWAANRLNKDKS